MGIGTNNNNNALIPPLLKGSTLGGFTYEIYKSHDFKLIYDLHVLIDDCSL